ncbi:hypothetical protein [Streptomyces sp. SCSIO ZS0520]|uniref:hypothetical protein n=1 Tax=Streptomyces sp. SCSIO ZS0520 TaxID=2892996 RepID=UPI0021DAFAFE|nr:hypothetical protein [Streptomyces sp. SCSIO ZS0520]
MLADIGGGGNSQGAAADLKVGAGVLLTFKQRVDKILDEFEGSNGSASKVGHLRFTQGAVTGSADFHEAVALHSEYESIHERITSLSKMLSLQIEAMGIAVHGAEIGFDNLEEDERRRFWEIQTRVDREIAANEQRQDPHKDIPSNERKGVGGELS